MQLLGRHEHGGAGQQGIGILADGDGADAGKTVHAMLDLVGVALGALLLAGIGGLDLVHQKRKALGAAGILVDEDIDFHLAVVGDSLDGVVHGEC